MPEWAFFFFFLTQAHFARTVPIYQAENANAMPPITDDKSQYCIPFVLERLRIHAERQQQHGSDRPFFLGLNGVQGAGKTVLV